MLKNDLLSTQLAQPLAGAVGLAIGKFGGA